MPDTPAVTPDPTELTNDALEREVLTLHRELEMRERMREREHVDLRELIETRLAGMDKATELLSATVNRTPTEITKEIQHLRGILDERLSSVTERFIELDRLNSTQFHERDIRTEREARDNKLAVDAAFAAQEKQATAQNEGNQLAISKSESATAETIKTNQELSRSEINALRKSHEDQKIRQAEVDEDLKKRLAAIELQLTTVVTANRATHEQRFEGRAVSSLVLAIIGTVVAVAIAASAIIPLLFGK